MTDTDNSPAFVDQIKSAISTGTTLDITGSNSKHFLGREQSRIQCAQTLSTLKHRGILYYEPSELVLRARCGTPISEIEEILKNNRQRLPFNPPQFTPGTTFGGAIATGLTGPNLPYWGSVRDSVLGIQLINGEGKVLNFGGQVIKNVAGYDISRFLVGSMGTLGLISEIAVKVIPDPDETITLSSEIPDENDALTTLRNLKQKSLPIIASCYIDNNLILEFSATKPAISAVKAKLGNSWHPVDNRFWQQLRDHQLDFFQKNNTLWRINVCSSSNLDNFKNSIPEPQLAEWDGMQRWFYSDLPELEIRSALEPLQGQANCFKSTQSIQSVFHPLPSAIKTLSKKIKLTFDPQQIFNPGRMYEDW